MKDEIQYIESKIEKIKEDKEAMQTYFKKRDEEVKQLQSIKKRILADALWKDDAKILLSKITNVGGQEQNEENNKVCSKCGKSLSLSHFYKGQFWCKDCYREYSKTYKRKSDESLYRSFHNILVQVLDGKVRDTKFMSKLIKKKRPYFSYKYVEDFVARFIKDAEKDGYKYVAFENEGIWQFKFIKKNNFTISNGTKPDAIPLVSSGVKDRNTIKNWSKFRSR